MATVISSAARLRVPRPSRGTRDLIARAASSSSNPGDGGESGDEGAYVVVFRGQEIRAKPGQRLRTALLLGGESPHNGGANAINCRGLGTCGTCAVEIVPSGAVTPRDWTDAERIRLNFPPHGPPGNARLRLSCQVRLGGDCEVVKHPRVAAAAVVVRRVVWRGLRSYSEKPWLTVLRHMVMADRVASQRRG